MAEAADLSDISKQIRNMLCKHVPPLAISKDTDQIFEVCGTREVMQGRQKVRGIYFGSIVSKPKDIRLYYFPIYTHVKKFEWISPELRNCLKGKSCFHIRLLSKSLSSDLEKMIDAGIELYRIENLI